jgi:hypothetical protein
MTCLTELTAPADIGALADVTYVRTHVPRPVLGSLPVIHFKPGDRQVEDAAPLLAA